MWEHNADKFGVTFFYLPCLFLAVEQILCFCVSEESDPTKFLERRGDGVVGNPQGQVMWLLDLAQPPLSHQQGQSV
jgi:hypothetical protein